MRKKIISKIARLVQTVLITIVFVITAAFATPTPYTNGQTSSADRARNVGSYLANPYGISRNTKTMTLRPERLGRTYGPSAEPSFVPGGKADELVPASLCNDGWRDGPPVNGVGGNADAIAVDAAGNVYVGGSFAVAGSTTVNNIAKWNGSSWSALGSGTNGGVSSIVVSGSELYVGGTFTTAGGTTANNIAKWNGSSWSQVGSGLEHPVYDLAISGSTVYAAGGLWGQEYHVGYVSVWNGSNWSGVGPEMDLPVSSIAISGSDVYAGHLSTAGGMAANQIVKWNGTGWTNIGAAFSGYFSDLAVSGADLYATGSRSISGLGAQIGIVAKWNGSTWIELGSGMSNPGSGSYAAVNSIAISGSDLYVGGYFSSASGVPVNGVAKWNGSSWSALGSWGGGAYRLTVSGTDVYFGASSFSSADGVLRADGIAKWDGTSWSALGAGIYRSPTAFAASGTDVYAAGYFTTNDGNTYSRAAKWNGTDWIALGGWPSGPPGTATRAEAIAVSGSDVYVGGERYNPLNGSDSRGFVLKWTGSNWIELGSGMTSPPNSYLGGQVRALAVSGGDIYAGGSFTSAGGTPATGIAKWNGSSWSPVGTGMNSSVYALAISGTNVYAGGDFTTAGEIPVFYIAKWNGTDWSTIGNSPLDSASLLSPENNFRAVTGILVLGTEIYAVGSSFIGDYGDIGTVSKWDGSDWSLLPMIQDGPVYSIVEYGTSVYVGGYITTAGGTPVNGIAKWNGTGWSSLGSGLEMYGLVSTLTVVGSDLFVGGSFHIAGCHVSANFARYSLSGPTARRTDFDFDGDHRADMSVFRPADRVWYLNQSTAGFSAAQFGLSSDQITPGDFDGDGKTDIAVWRPSTGTWYIQQSTAGFTAKQWGLSTDLPVPGDYDGDGKTDIAAFRPASGTWFIQPSGGGAVISTQFGQAGDKPVPGDYDGDGKTDIAVFRPSEGNWYFLKSTAGFTGIHFGNPTDKVVPGDYDGDGKTDPAVYRDGTWYLFQSTAGFTGIPFGIANDIPAPGDFDGDGKTDFSVFRPSSGAWFQQRSTSGFFATQFGQNGDKPVPAGYVPVQ